MCVCVCVCGGGGGEGMLLTLRWTMQDHGQEVPVLPCVHGVLLQRQLPEFAAPASAQLTMLCACVYVLG